jgi:hypothetical protein
MCVKGQQADKEQYLCCRATSPRQITCATSICVGHSPVAMQPNTPHSCVRPVSSLLTSALITAVSLLLTVSAASDEAISSTRQKRYNLKTEMHHKLLQVKKTVTQTFLAST